MVSENKFLGIHCSLPELSSGCKSVCVLKTMHYVESLSYILPPTPHIELFKFPPHSKRLRTILHQSSSLNLIVDNKIHDTLKLKAHVGCLWISTYIYVYKCLSTHAHAHANVPAHTSAFFRKHHCGTHFSSEHLLQLLALHFFLVTFHQFVSITRAWTQDMDMGMNSPITWH